jgi:hypothetical protein
MHCFGSGWIACYMSWFVYVSWLVGCEVSMLSCWIVSLGMLLYTGPCCFRATNVVL